MMEEFRDIPGWEGYYQVSNLGRVKSMARVVTRPYRDTFRKRPVKEIIKNNFLRGKKRSYWAVELCRDGKRKAYSLHVLLAMAFKGHVIDRHKLIVDHIDNNRYNNSLDNLQLITHSENCLKDKPKKYEKEREVL